MNANDKDDDVKSIAVVRLTTTSTPLYVSFIVIVRIHLYAYHCIPFRPFNSEISTSKHMCDGSRQRRPFSGMEFIDMCKVFSGKWPIVTLRPSALTKIQNLLAADIFKEMSNMGDMKINK